jgi:hypothetical protein
VLRRLAADGLPPPHHFYITFHTGHPGVELPDFLRERYPGDMTVVLQHQYWDLEVDDDAFAVTLSFNDQPHRVRVPFNAIRVFADPGVEFGLQFTLEPGPGEGEPAGLLAGPGRAQAPAAAKPDGGAEVVPLDRFRKK